MLLPYIKQIENKLLPFIVLPNVDHISKGKTKLIFFYSTTKKRQIQDLKKNLKS
jgi:hypothetical protein